MRQHGGQRRTHLKRACNIVISYLQILIVCTPRLRASLTSAPSLHTGVLHFCDPPISKSVSNLPPPLNELPRQLSRAQHEQSAFTVRCFVVHDGDQTVPRIPAQQAQRATCRTDCEHTLRRMSYTNDIIQRCRSTAARSGIPAPSPCHACDMRHSCACPCGRRAAELTIRDTRPIPVQLHASRDPDHVDPHRDGCATKQH